jgi:NADH dehydrogenase
MTEERSASKRPRIVIVGGGAGGLELATRLGKSLGGQKADVALIDYSRTHIWKPLLHEVAAGTLDSYEDQVAYLAQASSNRFQFVLGRMIGLDRENKRVLLAPLLNSAGAEIIPERDYPYDLLIIAVGSICNDFGVKGVAEHCLFLDTKEQAEQFQARLLEAFLHANAVSGPLEPGLLDIAIVGGGATGIELSAQLHQATRLLAAYGLDNVKPTDIKIHLVEAADRLLPELPLRISDATLQQLTRLGVQVHLGERVDEVTAAGVHTRNGHFIPAHTKVWAAGIKAPDFLHGIGGLETNRLNQLVVRQTLQTTRDDDIFAFGDCAACPWPGKNMMVPPRAQAAHQQASLLHRNLHRKLSNGELMNYRYRDYGSLVSLGKYSTVGSLMGYLLGTVMIEGFIARLVYLSLYKMHQLALFGIPRVGMLVVLDFFRRSLRPKIKLH